MTKPDVKRTLPPMSDNGIMLYCDDSPERPGYEPQDGDVGYKLVFPLHDGTQLVLMCGTTTYEHFVAMLSAAAADDADDALNEGQ